MTEELTAEEKKEKIQRLQELDDIRFLVDTPQGFRFVKRLLDMCHAWNHPFTGNSWTYFKCGEQNIGFKLFRDVAEIAPDKIATLMRSEDTNG